MMALLLAAMYSGDSSGSWTVTSHWLFVASFDDSDADCSGCTSARARYEGAWAAVFNGLSVDMGDEEQEGEWLRLGDINSALAFLWCSCSAVTSSLRVQASQIMPSLLRSSSCIGPAIDREFGPPVSSPLMFYLSRLLLVPSHTRDVQCVIVTFCACAAAGVEDGG